MAKNRSDTRKQRAPSFSGRFIVDSWRGQPRIRSWPRKRGPSKSPQVRLQNAWFKSAKELVKFAPARQWIAAINAVRNTGLYPADVFMRAMGQGFFDIIDHQGRTITYRQRRITPVTFQGVSIKSPVAIPAAVGGLNIVTWPLPLIDTAGFWSMAAPTRLTIPTGVTIVNVVLELAQVSTGGPLLLVQILDKAGLPVAFTQATSSGNVGCHAETGPIVVAAGDWFEAAYVVTRSGSFHAFDNNFACYILEAG